jgi:hypothetical protein
MQANRVSALCWLARSPPHGLVIESLHGDYLLNSYNAGTSPRIILVARKK